MTFLDSENTPSNLTEDEAEAIAEGDEAAAEATEAAVETAEAAPEGDAPEAETPEAPANIDPETGEVIAAEAVDAARHPEGVGSADTDGTQEAVDAEDLLEEAAEPVDSPWNRPGRWYVVHTQSGYEKKVKQNLEARTSSMNMEGRIHEVVIPMEDVVEIKGGKKQVVQKKMFPGYLLVRCLLDDDSWYVIRNTPGVTGFVGAGNKPSPLPRRDVETFLSIKDEDLEVQTKKGRARLEHELHETVRVKEGPFANFSGEIVEINEDQLKVKVLVDIFGRETPVELDFSQVAKF